MSKLALVEWKKDVLETAADRFEMGNMCADLKNDIWQLRSDMAHRHTSLIKWMSAFWIGQLGFTVSIVGVILRAVRFP